MIGSRAIRIILLLLVAASTGCQRERSSGAAREIARAPIAMPLPSTAAPAVRAQIEARYAELTRAINERQASEQLAEAYGQFGMLLMAADFLDASEPAFLEAQAHAPRDSRWAYLLGHVYMRLGRLDESAAAFSRSIELDSSNGPAYLWLGRVKLALDAVADAEGAFRHVLAQEPGNAAAAEGLGRVALARHEYSQAVKLLEQALANAPQASGLHHPLAMAYRGVGDEADATAHLRLRGTAEVLIADPLLQRVADQLPSPMVYEARGREALSRSDWRLAADEFRKGIEAAGENRSIRSVLHQQLGTAVYQAGDVNGALEQFELAVRDAPESSKAHYSLGVLMASIGRQGAALEELRAAVKYDPADVQARLQLSVALRANGRIEESQREYAEAIRLDPRIAQTR